MNGGHTVDTLITSICYSLTVHFILQISIWRFHKLPTPNLLATLGLRHKPWMRRAYIKNRLYLWDAWGGPAFCSIIPDLICFFCLLPVLWVGAKAASGVCLLALQGLNAKSKGKPILQGRVRVLLPATLSPWMGMYCLKNSPVLGTCLFAHYGWRENSLSIYRKNFFDSSMRIYLEFSSGKGAENLMMKRQNWHKEEEGYS